MGEYSRSHLRGQGLSECLHGLLRPEQLSGRHPDRHIRDGVERPGDRVVLISGDDHCPSRTDQGLYGDIQAVGGIVGKDHLFRLGDLEQAGCRLPAGKGRCCCVHGRLVTTSARTGIM